MGWGLAVKVLQPRANRATTSEASASRSAAEVSERDSGTRQDSPNPKKMAGWALYVYPRMGRARRMGVPAHRFYVNALHWFWISYELALVPVGVGWGYFAGGVEFCYLSWG